MPTIDGNPCFAGSAAAQPCFSCYVADSSGFTVAWNTTNKQAISAPITIPGGTFKAGNSWFSHWYGETTNALGANAGDTLFVHLVLDGDTANPLCTQAIQIGQILAVQYQMGNGLGGIVSFAANPNPNFYVYSDLAVALHEGSSAGFAARPEWNREFTTRGQFGTGEGAYHKELLDLSVDHTFQWYVNYNVNRNNPLVIAGLVTKFWLLK